ncbi:MAG TPA: glycosyltransferase [Opitutaceae bacterium]|nr:glycosyltransferase [Opitutaceae bacterium]
MNRRLLFVGVSTMQHHAGQHKLYFLADALGRRGWPTTVLVPDFEENRVFLRDRPWIEALFYPHGNGLTDAWQKSRVLREDRWSAIWLVGVGLRSFLYRGNKYKHIPLIKDFDEFPSMMSHLGRWRRLYLRAIERAMIAQADGFTCASALIEGLIRRQRPGLAGRLCRLAVAISEDEHRVDPAVVARLRRADAGRPTLLYVGSMNRFYEEQIDELIGLARVLHCRGLPARVRLLGGGPELDHFKDRAARAGLGGAIEFAGHIPREELASHMDAAQVLIFPFPANPFNLSRCPTKAYHYAAANRPVVTNRVGEVAALFGEKAWYYPERDVEAFADCCLNALAQGAAFDNGIPFAGLTWKSRAGQFSQWLLRHGWLPEGAPMEAEPAGAGRAAGG